MAIKFYSTDKEHGYMSNFSKHGFHLDSMYWRTVEHYFQAQKFRNTDLDSYNEVLQAYTPAQAKAIGNDRNRKIDEKWDSIKNDVMKKALVAKFTENDDIREKLLATGEEELIENSRTDFYWGCGDDETGLNILGKLLMEVRSELNNVIPKRKSV